MFFSYDRSIFHIIKNYKMTNNIELTFKNESNDNNNSEVVIFQKNIATDFDEIAIAWKVIKNCATGWKHPFTLPRTFEIAASDAWGNKIADPLTASNGQCFHVYQGGSGNSLGYKEPSFSKEEVQLDNDLLIGSINAEVYKNGKFLAIKRGLSPGQKAVFKFKPSLWIGVVSQVQEGQILHSAILSGIDREIDLFDIISADIIMVGGGTGPSAGPFEFVLDNVVNSLKEQKIRADR